MDEKIMVEKERAMSSKPRYNGWLISDSFIKRALAVYGYGFVAWFMIFVPIFILIMIFGLVFWWMALNEAAENGDLQRFQESIELEMWWDEVKVLDETNM